MATRAAKGALKSNQRPVGLVQSHATARGGDVDVFDPDAELTRYEDAGLDGEGLSLLEDGVLRGVQVWRLVDIHSDAVPKAVAEVISESGGLDDVACGLVDRTAQDTWSKGLRGSFLGCDHRVVCGA